MSDPAIAARGLVKRFGPVVALRGIDLDVAPGTLLAVLGPNGAGKSTLLGLIAGLARPSGGVLRVAGGAAHARATRARVGYIGHESFLYPDLTARENLIFAARLYGVPAARARADALLEEYDLAPFAARRARTFSQGMAHRLSIARGLVHDPPLLLLDEPFAGLDGVATRRLAARLRAARAGGRTAVLVTHDLPRAAEVADAALVLARGRVVHRAEGDALAPVALERAYLQAVDGAA